jgi:hypothetical protein
MGSNQTIPNSYKVVLEDVGASRGNSCCPQVAILLHQPRFHSVPCGTQKHFATPSIIPCRVIQKIRSPAVDVLAIRGPTPTQVIFHQRRIVVSRPTVLIAAFAHIFPLGVFGGLVHDIFVRASLPTTVSGFQHELPIVFVACVKELVPISKACHFCTTFRPPPPLAPARRYTLSRPNGARHRLPRLRRTRTRRDERRRSARRITLSQLSPCTYVFPPPLLSRV